jgi:hypothetical protein
MEISMAKLNKLQTLEAKFLAMSKREDEILAIMRRYEARLSSIVAHQDTFECGTATAQAAQDNKIAALDEAICPRVAARLTALEKNLARLKDTLAESTIAFKREPVQPAPPVNTLTIPPAPTASEALLWLVAYSYATKLPQHKLYRMIEALERTFNKRNANG